MNTKKTILSSVIVDMAAGPFGSNLKVSSFVDMGFPIIDGANLKGYKVTDNITKYVTEEKARSLHRSIAKRNDVVVTISGTLGQIAYIPENSRFEEYLCSQRQFRVTFSDEIYVPYIVFYFHTYEGQNKILSFANQVGVPALSQPLKNFRQIVIDLPSIEDQKKIAHIVEMINNKIEENEKINDNLLEQAMALFSNALECNSVFIVSRPLSNLADVKGGKRLPKGVNLITEPNEHPYIRVRDLNGVIYASLQSDYEYVDDETQKSISRYIVNENDILLSIVGTIGLTGIVDASLNNANLTENCVKITNLEEISPEYLFLFLRTVSGQNAISQGTVGAVQAKLPIKNIQAIEVPIIPDNERMILQDKLASLFKLINCNATENKSLQNIRDTLLPKLMSGSIDVANIDL